MNKSVGHIIIIGNGIAGITAAREIRKRSNKKITVISAESRYFFSRTALMYVYMGHMKPEHLQPYETDFWKKNRIDLLFGYVNSVSPSNNSITLKDGSSLHYDQLLIATGSIPNKFGWPGEDLQGVTGLYSLQDLDYLERHTKRGDHAVIVGGGLIGIEVAEMLLSRQIRVTMLVRETGFWGNVLPPGESQLVNRYIQQHGVELKLTTTLQEITGNDTGYVQAVVTGKGETINCQLVVLATGVRPNIRFLQSSGIDTNRGVKVNRFLETNHPHIYAIGDCAEQLEPNGLRPPIEAVWYTGKIMGETVAKSICGSRTPYEPGHWYNSAKFFDIEYQTYGWVSAIPRKDEAQFYWEHPAGKKCIRVSYHQVTRKFIGINCLGIRMRHEFFNQVLNQELTVDAVIKQLHLANFDPEFFEKYERSIELAFLRSSSTESMPV